jgi:predicted lipid-binding transport protein (Tim44 family)
MKRLFIALMVAAGAMSMVVTEAEAKRMGGGGSFGKQSQGVSRQAPTQSSQATNAAKPAAPAAAPGAAAPKPASPWRGILGGALLGLGLGALLSHLGIGGALASMISTILMVALFALAAMFIYRMIMRRKNGINGRSTSEPAFAGGYSARNSTPEIGSRLEPYGQPAALQADSASIASGAAAAAVPWGVPADFDVSGFLRHAKTYFIRLQAAWDRGDTNDIREFTTPEMFAELKMQIQERGATPNNTDVMSLEAELMGIETVEGEYLASVKFTGMIEESENASAEPFAEVWNLVKPVSGNGGWALAGIQQLP